MANPEPHRAYLRQSDFLLALVREEGRIRLTQKKLSEDLPNVVMDAPARVRGDGYKARLLVALACAENGATPPQFSFCFSRAQGGCCLVHVQAAADQSGWTALIDRREHPEFLPLTSRFDFSGPERLNGLDDATVRDLVGQVLKVYYETPAV